MDGRVELAAIGWAVGDPSRASMLSALMSGQALTAGELAREAGVAPSTASSHLAALHDQGLIIPVRQGRHRYFRLAGAEVAELLERLSNFAADRSRARGRAAEPMRLARTCYDHLAGELGVRVLDAMVADGRLLWIGPGVALSEKGRAFARELGLALSSQNQAPDCRACLDFTERRPHLAGPMARELLTLMRQRLWLIPGDDRRVLRPTPAGLAAFDRFFAPPTVQAGRPETA